MKKFTVGSVPYGNAIPLTAWFEELGEESPISVIFDVPSKLPALLENGQADAILVSSVDALRMPSRRMAEGVCIGSNGPVKSVRVFSKVPYEQVTTLALDASSMTSNRLAQIILNERFGVRPTLADRPPNLNDMLAEFDACVLIGDIGMTADGSNLHVLDLGEEWTNLTDLPFVWAAWIGNENVTPELTKHLQTAAHHYGAGRNATEQGSRADFIALAQTKLDWTEAMIEDYFFEVMIYDMDDRMLEGFKEFRRRLLVNGFEDCHHFPALITAL
ncbi:hypothetical protein BH11ARM1_BH11ARM1_12570 [soil metagenome]